MFSFKIPDSLYDKLMKFIGRNEKIPAFIKVMLDEQDQSEARQTHLANIAILENALVTGDTQCPLFNPEKSEEEQENLIVYLICLAKKLQDSPTSTQLTENQIFTGFVYVMALLSRPFEARVVNINDDAAYKAAYIEKMVKKTEESFSLKIDGEKINEEISALKGADAWQIILSLPKTIPAKIAAIVNLPLKQQRIDELVVAAAGSEDNFEAVLAAYEEIKPDVTGLVYTNLGSGPLFDVENNEYRIPSIGMRYSFLFQINPCHIKLFPMFGIIKEETLRKLHARGYHPYQLHGGTWVLRNLEKADGIKTRKVTVAEHDGCYHAVSASLPDKEQFNYLYTTLIPNVENAIKTQMDDLKNNVYQGEIAEAHSKFIKQLQTLLINLGDMDIGLTTVQEKFLMPDLLKSWAKFVLKNAFMNKPIVDPQYTAKFYFEIFKSNPEDEFLLDLFQLSLSMGGYTRESVLKLIKENEKPFPIPFNIELFEEEYTSINKRKVMSAPLKQLRTLLTSCQTAREFEKQLLSYEYRTLYVDLLNKDLLYIPGVIALPEEVFQKMKLIALGNTPVAVSSALPQQVQTERRFV